MPYDTLREWREWSGHREDVVRVEAAERRLGLRRAVQRALVLGRLYGGGAIVIGTGETDPAALARPLDPDTLPRGGLKFPHAVSRWQLAAPAIDRDPLSPWFGEAVAYDVVAPERGSLRLHPSRVVPRALNGRWTAGGEAASVLPLPSTSPAEGAALPRPLERSSHAAEDPPAEPTETPQAPDGTPVTPLAFRPRGRELARAIGALAGLAGRLVRRWWPEEAKEQHALRKSRTISLFPSLIF